MIEFDKSALRDLGFDPEHLLNLIMEYGFKFWRITTKGALIPIGKQDLLSDQYTHHTDLVLKKIQ